MDISKGSFSWVFFVCIFGAFMEGHFWGVIITGLFKSKPDKYGKSSKPEKTRQFRQFRQKKYIYIYKPDIQDKPDEADKPNKGSKPYKPDNAYQPDKPDKLY